MSSNFKDHFSETSENYSRYRPSYPPELFEYLASLAKQHDRAWDCATGTGQSAIGLAKYFTNVIATDASETQIKESVSNANVDYKVALAEKSNLEENSIDLITVAQALHWFNLDEFTKEVDRILKPGGVLAVWTYGIFNIQPDIDAVVNHLYEQVLEPYWPDERKIVEGGYRDITFPFEEKCPPKFNMQLDWDLPQLLGYLSTWSAVKKYEKETGKNPLNNIRQKLNNLWIKPENILKVKWPLTIKLWIKSV